VLSERPDQAERDHLVGEAGTPVNALGYPELHVEPQQVLLDRRFRHDEVARDLLRRGRRNEGIIGKRRTAQGYQHVKLASRQFGCRGSAEFCFGCEFLLRQSLNSAAGGAEGDHITIVKHATSDWPPVHPRAVT